MTNHEKSITGEHDEEDFDCRPPEELLALDLDTAVDFILDGLSIEPDWAHKEFNEWKRSNDENHHTSRSRGGKANKKKLTTVRKGTMTKRYKVHTHIRTHVLL
jgi:hypothetical protein